MKISFNFFPILFYIYSVTKKACKMKKGTRYFLITLVICLVTLYAAGQSPQAFKYQSIVRDSVGNILTNSNVGFRCSLLESGSTGAPVYIEIHNMYTNAFGLANLNIGEGTVEYGDFMEINWAEEGYFLRIEMDIGGGTDYEFMGVAQLLSVPYALYAENAGNVIISDTSSTNELQSLAFSNDTLYLIPGNAVFIPDNVNDADSDPTNELQSLAFSNDTLYLISGNAVFIPDNVNDADSDTTNELQQLFIIGSNLTISNGNSVDLSELSPWVRNGDNIYFNEGNVGIGTSYPNRKFVINDGGCNYYVGEKHSAYAYSSQIAIGNLHEGSAGLWFDASDGDFIGNDYGSLRQLNDLSIELSNRSHKPIKFGIGDIIYPDNIKMTILPSGNVGIGTEQANTKLHVTNGDIYIDDINCGVILKSPDGNCWRMTVSNSGEPVFTPIACP